MPDEVIAASDETAIRDLYGALLAAWNARDARAYAALFAPDGSLVGFDGSQNNGRDAIEGAIGAIFAHHRTPTYVGKVVAIRVLRAGVALVRAAAGLVPPGQADLNPALNSVQSLTIVRDAGGWRIAHVHNTPAQFHGRPDLAEQLTAELRALL